MKILEMKIYDLCGNKELKKMLINMYGNGIIFRDRALKAWETSHYECERCGCEINPDVRHKCYDLI